jgi:DHA1 family bicyclomycin/chloramphenicol resistance-like MFS transporter
LAKGPGRIELVAIAAILMATVALSIDIMLPALGEMGRDLGIADNNKRQWIITALFLGLTGGQLFFGPLSDSVGRRPAIMAGIAVFVAGSALCALATSFEAIMLGRIMHPCPDEAILP